MAAFVKENIRDVVFGSSTNQLFSFGNEVEEELVEQAETNVFEELKITKYLFEERSGLFCREKSMYSLLTKGRDSARL